MATANPYNPNGQIDNDTVLNVTEYTTNDGETLQSGGYYIKRHMRVPMKVDGQDKHVAIFPKTIASQVLELTDKAFVKKSNRDILEQLGILGPTEIDETQHLSINGVKQPSFHDIEPIQASIDSLISAVGDSTDGLIKDVETLQAFFDGVDDSTEKIDKWHEIVEFLDGIDETDKLAGLIESAASNLLSTNNIWTGTNTFTKDLSAVNFVTSGDVHIEKLDLITKYEMGKISFFNTAAGFNTTLIIPTALDKSITGTIALTKDVPYIGFEAPSAPKAGDMWFSA